MKLEIKRVHNANGTINTLYMDDEPVKGYSRLFISKDTPTSETGRVTVTFNNVQLPDVTKSQKVKWFIADLNKDSNELRLITTRCADERVYLLINNHKNGRHWY